MAATATHSLFAPFCAACGARLPALGKKAIGCPHCGEELVLSDGTRASAWRAAPWIAALLSLFLPGAGQVWNGELGKGLLIFLTFWLIVPWLFGVLDAWRHARRAARAPAAARLG